MKHVKQFEVLSNESTLLTKKYAKYFDLISKKYNAHNVLFYENKGMLQLVLKYAYILDKENFQKIYRDFEDFEYRFIQDNKAIRFEVFLPEEYIEKFDFELDTNKYNL